MNAQRGCKRELEIMWCGCARMTECVLKCTVQTNHCHLWLLCSIPVFTDTFCHPGTTTPHNLKLSFASSLGIHRLSLPGFWTTFSLLVG